MSEKSSEILLDTHTWLWLTTGSHELTPAVVTAIEDASRHSSVYVSSISIWEVGTFLAKKRILLRTSIHEWVKQSLDMPGMALAPLSPEIAIESTMLPDTPPGDPADRIIVATARVLSLTLFTRDRGILSYAKQGHLKADKV